MRHETGDKRLETKDQRQEIRDRRQETSTFSKKVMGDGREYFEK